jgi:neutral ceramidase
MESLLFNYNLSDITPDEPVLLGGYANRKGLSGKVHRSLTSRCVVLRFKEICVCLIVNDLMDADPEIIRNIQSQISLQTGISMDSILITSIHTHSAPDIEYGRSDANDRYILRVSKKIADNAIAVIRDQTAFRKAVLKYGKSVCSINIARRDVRPGAGKMSYRIGDPDGLRDEDVEIIELSDESNFRKVTLFNYACHPVTLGYESLAVSTDYPGQARETIEKGRGGMAVFLNGAAGDLNPREANHTDPEMADRLGEQLGQSVLLSQLHEYQGSLTLNSLADIVKLPYRDQHITKVLIESEVKRKASDITEFFNWQEMLIYWKNKICEIIDKQGVENHFPCKVNVWKLGNTLIFFTQGELFVKYQIQLKKSFPGFQVLCVAYVHGTGAYIPTSDVFENKGYEADQAYIYEMLPSPLSPSIEELYTKEMMVLINRIIENNLPNK